MPLLHYDCTVNKLNGTQNVDYYVFAQVQKDYSRGWILGMVKSKKYFDTARFIREGEVDPSNDFTSRCDMWNLPINQLRPIKAPEGWTE